MKLNKPPHLGDLVEIEYVKKIAGYLYKVKDGEVVISPSLDVGNGDALIQLFEKDVVSIFSHRVDKADLQKKKQETNESNDGAIVIQFPSGEEIS